MLATKAKKKKNMIFLSFGRIPKTNVILFGFQFAGQQQKNLLTQEKVFHPNLVGHKIKHFFVVVVVALGLGGGISATFGQLAVWTR